MALFTPDATPALRSSASASTVAVSGATVIDSPSENTSSARQELRHVVHVLVEAQHERQPDGGHERADAHEEARAVAVGEHPEAR